MDIIKKHNLPSYIKGKTFSEASKLIQKKFGDRNDPESIQTRDEMLGRLRDAQESVKQAQQPAQMEGAPNQSMGSNELLNQHFGGGLMGLGSAASGAATAAKGVAGATKAASTIGADIAGGAADALASSDGEGVDPMGLVSMFTGSDIDQSGDVLPNVPSVGSSVASSAMAGASAGASFGPYGAAIGAVVGGGAGLVTGLSDKNRATDMTKVYDMKQSRARETDIGDDNDNGADNTGAENQNALAGGGYVSGPGPGLGMPVQDGSPLSNYMNKMRMPNVNPVDQLGEANDIPWDAHNKQENSFSDMTEPMQKAPAIQREDGYNVTAGGSIDGQDDGPVDAKKKNKMPLASYLRYAPIASNAAQLLALKKPEEVRSGRSTARYEEQLVDEKAMQNVVAQGNSSNRRAIIANSEGSGSTARANLLASGVSNTKALSDAHAQAAAMNRAEVSKGQMYNDKVDDYNRSRDDQDRLVNEQNQAGFENQRSSLIAGLANSGAKVGKEELMKKYPELMGMDYDMLANYLAKAKAAKTEKAGN